jgi:hypothetical protein
VDLAEREPPRRAVADHDPPAGGAQVDGRDPGCAVSQRGSSSQESGGDPGIDGDVQPGGLGQVTTGEGEDRVGDVGRQDLLLQQLGSLPGLPGPRGPLGVARGMPALRLGGLFG